MQEVAQAKQLRKLQKGTHLKRMLAEAIVGNEVLKEALDDNSKPCTQTRSGAEAGAAGQMLSACGMPSI